MVLRMCCDDNLAVLFPCLVVVGCRKNELRALLYPTIINSRPRDTIEVFELQYLYDCRPVEMRRKGTGYACFISLKFSWKHPIHGVTLCMESWQRPRIGVWRGQKQLDQAILTVSG